MARPEKVQAVDYIRQRLEGARAVFLAEYSGLSVKEQQELRRSLRAGGAEFKVVKMTLARRAAAELDIGDLDELLLGPTGLTFADRDAVEAAKALKEFATAHSALVVKGGLLGRDFLTPERVSELADIEPRDVLLAKLAGGFQAPMARLAGLVSALPRNLANAMLQLLDKRQAQGPQAVAEPTEAPEAPPEEAAVEPEAALEEAAADEAPAAEETEIGAAPEDTAGEETDTSEDEPAAQDEKTAAEPEDTAEESAEDAAEESAEEDAEESAEDAAEESAGEDE
jgi:large subunit ribosomal protein L10